MSNVRQFVADGEGLKRYITQSDLNEYKSSTAKNKNSIIVISDYGIIYDGKLISI